MNLCNRNFKENALFSSELFIREKNLHIIISNNAHSYFVLNLIRTVDSSKKENVNFG